MSAPIRLIVSPAWRSSQWSVREHGRDRAWRRFPTKGCAVAGAIRKGGLNYRVTVIGPNSAWVESVYTRETTTP